MVASTRRPSTSGLTAFFKPGPSPLEIVHRPVSCQTSKVEAGRTPGAKLSLCRAPTVRAFIDSAGARIRRWPMARRWRATSAGSLSSVQGFERHGRHVRRHQVVEVVAGADDE